MKELINIQSELKAPKSQYNSFGRYKYRNAEDVLEAVKPLLKDNKCVLLLSDEIKNIENRFYVEATATIINSAGETIQVKASAREEETKKGMDGAQITGASSSYARKYALNGLFCIDDTKDADSTNTHGKAPEKKQPVKPVEKKITAAQVKKAVEEVYDTKTEAELLKLWRADKQMQLQDDFIEAVKNHTQKVRENETK